MLLNTGFSLWTTQFLGLNTVQKFCIMQFLTNPSSISLSFQHGCTAPLLQLYGLPGSIRHVHEQLNTAVFFFSQADNNTTGKKLGSLKCSSLLHAVFHIVFFMIWFGFHFPIFWTIVHWMIAGLLFISYRVWICIHTFIFTLFLLLFLKFLIPVLSS